MFRVFREDAAEHTRGNVSEFWMPAGAAVAEANNACFSSGV